MATNQSRRVSEILAATSLAAPQRGVAVAGPTGRMVQTATSVQGLQIDLDPDLLAPVTSSGKPNIANRLSLAGGLATPYFTRIIVPDTIDEVATNYLQWAMGLGPHERLRERRILQGVNPRWDTEGSLGGADLVGGSGLSISVRAAKGVWAFRFVHPEEGVRYNKPATWWTVVRVTPVKDGCQIEHQVLRQTLKPEPMPLTSVVPAIIRDYLDRSPAQGGVQMRRFALRLRGEAVEPWVKDVLLGAGRDVPTVLITQPRDLAEGPCTDGDLLAKNLQGMASVAIMEDKKAAWVLANTLDAEGYIGKDWGAYNGAIRIYSPGITIGDSPLNHRLWISNHLLNKTPDQRVEMITSEVIQRQTATMPGRFVMVLDEVERAIRDEAAEQVRQEVAEHARAAVSQIEAQQWEIEEQKVEIKNLNDKIEDLNQVLEFSDTETMTLKAEKDELSRKLYEETLTKEAMSHRASGASAAARSRATRPSVEILEAVDAVMTGKPNLVQALTFLEWRYPERIRIHEDAYESAQDATDAHFRKEEQAFGLLQKLAGEFYDLFSVDGGGDAAGRKVFGNAVYASRESETAETSAVARKQREKVFEGVLYPMWRHLRIGSSSTATDGWRCHFDWDPTNRRIIVGHCGEHLDHR